ncbi:MAG TPA: class II glutamine amidotransferase [Vicinamibacteria bacterium]|nr:class II glutamine amidotransferase [Vicinamibacteria bacterium]
MCRLYGFRANEPTKVECSLAHAQNALLLQSRSDMLGRAHADGWGLAFYRNGGTSLSVERRERAAYEDLHFSATAERVYATTVVAHVRRATVGGPAAANTHPFRHGSWIFAHNGTVTDFAQIEGRLAAETDPDLNAVRRGTTDSERAFLWILSRMRREGIDVDADDGQDLDVGSIGELVTASVLHLSSMARSAKLNFLLTNGRVMVASRFGNSLYLLERDGVRDCEICGIPHVHHDTKRRYRAVIVASEPITYERWVEVPDAHLVSIERDLSLSVEPMS